MMLLDVPYNELYFEWICSLIDTVEYPSSYYADTLSVLFETEFTYVIQNDSDRAGDGKALRTQFVNETKLDVPPIFFMESCNMLEMMVALSNRYEQFTVLSGEECPGRLFWNMMENIGLTTNYILKPETIHHVVDVILNRQYDQNGSGGLFPLRYSDKDQREVPIWFQLNQYHNEGDMDNYVLERRIL